MPNGTAWRTALQALSTIVPAYQERRNLRHSADEIDRGYDEVSRRQGIIDQELGLAIGDAGESSDRERALGLNDYQVALQQARARAPAQGAPLTGERYEQEQTATNQAVNARGGRFADYLSRIDAPVRRNQNVGERMSRAGQVVATQQQGAGLANYAAMLRARRDRTDPLVGLLAEIASNIANNWQGRSQSAPQVVVRPTYPSGPVGPPRPEGQ